MNIKSKLGIIWSCCTKICYDTKQLQKGQKASYELLQLSHRLEKGLLITPPNTKPLWGWDKAYRMEKILKKNEDIYSSKTAKAVLSAFLTAKSKSQFEEDRRKCMEFIEDTHFEFVDTANMGGIRKVERPMFTTEEIAVVEKLFRTRNSCRDYLDKPIPYEIIAHAVEMANRCPSACNRQPYKVYVVAPSKLEKKLRHKLQYKSDKVLIITGDVRAYTSGELLDWLISPSIFAGYLSLSLHSLGIGSCIIRKDLVRKSVYNDAIKAVTNMDESERIILELFVGYYKDEFVAPVSNRAGTEEMVRIIN